MFEPDWKAQAGYMIDELKAALASPDPTQAMIGFAQKHGMNWNEPELARIIRLRDSETYSETPTYKAFIVHERLRSHCIGIIEEVYGQK